jgi:hypothetical protein
MPERQSRLTESRLIVLAPSDEKLGYKRHGFDIVSQASLRSERREGDRALRRLPHEKRCY